MYIGNTQTTTASYYPVGAANSDRILPDRGATAAGQGSGADSVTISENARRAAEAERALTQPLDDSAPGTYPLEMYAVPEWTAPYHVVFHEGVLGASNWYEENYPGMAAAPQAERAEYNTLVSGHYQALLDEHGLDTVPKRYNALIADAESSDALRQEFEARVNGDERLVFLMRKLGMGTFR